MELSRAFLSRRAASNPELLVLVDFAKRTRVLPGWAPFRRVRLGRSPVDDTVLQLTGQHCTGQPPRKQRGQPATSPFRNGVENRLKPLFEAIGGAHRGSLRRALDPKWAGKIDHVQ